MNADYYLVPDRQDWDFCSWAINCYKCQKATESYVFDFPRGIVCVDCFQVKGLGGESERPR